MEFFWEMLSLQETMFLLILTGVLIKKLKIIDAAGRKMLSDLLIDVILPCNIVESFLGGMVFPDGFARNCLLAVGDEDLIKIHFHTNTPWKVLEYCASLGDIYDVVVENMERQENLGSRGAFSPTASSVPTPALWGCRWPACCLGIWA